MYHYWVRNLFIFTLLVFFFVKCPLRIVWLTLPKGVCEEPFIEVILNHFGTFLCWRDSMFFNYIYQPAITGEKNSGMVHLYRCPRPYMVGRKVSSVCLLSRKLRVNQFLHVQCECLSKVFETKHSDLLSFMLFPVGVFSVWNPRSVSLLVLVDGCRIHIISHLFFFCLQRSPFHLHFSLDSNF